MLLPEFSITKGILNNISSLEYARSYIENTTILPLWERRLKKDTLSKTISLIASLTGKTYSDEEIKAGVDELKTIGFSIDITNIITALAFPYEMLKEPIVEENDLKKVNEYFVGISKYRTSTVTNKIPTEQILAQTVQTIDWLNSIDAKEIHPLIKVGIFYAMISAIFPFEAANIETNVIFSNLLLKQAGYSFKGFLCENVCPKNQNQKYEKLLNTIAAEFAGGDETDYTEWLEFFTENLAMEAINLREKIKLLAKDTKLAKAAGHHTLTPRQERIVEYIQDYGSLQNKDYARIFPDVSEDSILRDLKVLLEKQIVVKTGSTKSSRYELK